MVALASTRLRRITMLLPLCRSISLCRILLIALIGICSNSHAFTALSRSHWLGSRRSPTTIPPRGGTDVIITDANSMSSLSAIPSNLVCCSQLTAAASQLAAVLKAGPYGVLGLSAIASAVVIPLTQIRNLYAISVGYGLSVGVMGMVMRRLFAPPVDSLGYTLSGCTVFYGLRLAFYLLLREKAGWKPWKSRAEPARLKRIPFSVSLGIFYALLTTPVLYLLRATPSPDTWQYTLAWTGTILAWIGAVLEAVADTHKFLVKNTESSSDDESSFVGPTEGAYRLTRHPNYTGEVLHWVGTYLAGAACFHKSVVGWVASSAGLYGIVNIMLAATKGLEKRQEEKYGGQEAYEAWKSKVKAPLIPLIPFVASKNE